LFGTGSFQCSPSEDYDNGLGYATNLDITDDDDDDDDDDEESGYLHDDMETRQKWEMNSK